MTLTYKIKISILTFKNVLYESCVIFRLITLILTHFKLNFNKKILFCYSYIVGSETARLAENWRWALRVTPILGIIAVILIMLIKEPERGESEGSHNLATTTYSEDIKDLVKNRSFMLSTAGFTCVAFVAGALAWWGPKFIYLGLRMQPGNENLTLNE